MLCNPLSLFSQCAWLQYSPLQAKSVSLFSDRCSPPSGSLTSSVLNDQWVVSCIQEASLIETRKQVQSSASQQSSLKLMWSAPPRHVFTTSVDRCLSLWGLSCLKALYCPGDICIDLVFLIHAPHSVFGILSRLLFSSRKLQKEQDNRVALHDCQCCL